MVNPPPLDDRKGKWHIRRRMATSEENLDARPSPATPYAMNFSKWDTLFHLILFLLWMAAWSANHRDAVFNMYLARLDRLTSAVTATFRGIIPTQSAWVILAVLLGAVLLMQAILSTQGLPVTVIHGFEESIFSRGDLPMALAHGAAGFAGFLFKVWCIGLLYLGFRQTRYVSPARITLQHACKPMTLLPAEWRPVALLAFGIGLTYAVQLIGSHGVIDAGSSGFLRAGLSTLAAFVGVLAILSSVLMVLIIGSWVGLLTGSGEIHAICTEWLELFLGPFRGLPLRIGSFDLTPLVLFFVLKYTHIMAIGLLTDAYNGTLGHG
jgi:uncharacterized protein YggT (Ycf19 family)